MHARVCASVCDLKNKKKTELVITINPNTNIALQLCRVFFFFFFFSFSYTVVLFGYVNVNNVKLTQLEKKREIKLENKRTKGEKLSRTEE